VIALGWEGSAHAECRSVTEAIASTKALETSLIAEGARARRWRYVWGLTNETLAVGSFAVLPLYEREKRPDVVVGAFGSAFSGALTLLTPLGVEAAARDLERSTALGACERLGYDEGLALRYGEEESKRTGLAPHLFAIGGSAVVGGFIAIAFHHGVSGLITGATGVLLGEGQILTQPTSLTASHRGRVAKLVFSTLPALSMGPSETGQGFVLRASGTW
jgi:hypothetical protein